MNIQNPLCGKMTAHHLAVIVSVIATLLRTEAQVETNVSSNKAAIVSYRSEPGTTNLVRIEGTAPIINVLWKVEGNIIHGHMKADPGFQWGASQAHAGETRAAVELTIPVRSLFSVEADGKPHHKVMDDIMYRALREDADGQIRYRLTEIIPQKPRKEGDPLRFKTKGTLTVGGVTREIGLPVEMTVGDGTLWFHTQTRLKMSDFEIAPVIVHSSPEDMLMAHDEIKVTVDWTVVEANP